MSKQDSKKVETIAISYVDARPIDFEKLEQAVKHIVQPPNLRRVPPAWDDQAVVCVTEDQRRGLMAEGMNVVDLDRPTRIHVSGQVIDTGYEGTYLRKGCPAADFVPWIRCDPAKGKGESTSLRSVRFDEAVRIIASKLGVDLAKDALRCALDEECPTLYLVQLRSLDPCLARKLFGPQEDPKHLGAEPLAYYNQAIFLVRLTSEQIEKIRTCHQDKVKAVIAFTPEMKIDIGLGERLNDAAPFSVYRVCIRLACRVERGNGEELPLMLFRNLVLPMLEKEGMSAELLMLAQAAAAALTSKPAPGNFLTFTTHMPAIAMRKIARMPAVFRIEPAPPIHAEGEVASLVAAGVYVDHAQAPAIHAEGEVAPLVAAEVYVDHAQAPAIDPYRAWLNDRSVNPSKITVGINDFGIDPNHPMLAGRVECGRGCAESDHGTQVAGRVAGGKAPDKDDDALARDEDGFRLDLGQAPGANLIDLDVRHEPFDVARQCVTTEGANCEKGSILVNSWGRGISHPHPMDYGCQESDWDVTVRDADLFTPVRGADLSTPRAHKPLTVCKSAGNYGRRGLSRPAGAKNLIVTGSTKNLRRRLRGHWDVDSLACADIGRVHNCSSAGNCGDGRLRPDLVAPGWPVFTASCARHPRVAASSEPPSTSLANATTAGACAIVQAWWKKGGRRSPSPALVRALLINAAVDTEIEGERPNVWQGWGRLNLKRVLELKHETNALIFDQDGSEPLNLCCSEPRQCWELDFTPCSRHKPLIVTLVWTDPPGSPGTGTAGNPSIVNPLCLRLGKDVSTDYCKTSPQKRHEMSSKFWLGNNFVAGKSVRRGVVDAMQTASPGQVVNNVQQVIIRRPQQASYRVVVEALNLRGNALDPAFPYRWTTEKDGCPQQDFALVIRNAKQ